LYVKNLPTKIYANVFYQYIKCLDMDIFTSSSLSISLGSHAISLNNKAAKRYHVTNASLGG